MIFTSHPNKLLANIICYILTKRVTYKMPNIQNYYHEKIIIWFVDCVIIFLVYKLQ